MAIVGIHTLVYTSEPAAVRAIMRDVFGWPHVDAGDGWLIFTLPPAEIGVHPAEGPTFESGIKHMVSLMCDDIHSTIRTLRSKPGLEVKGEPKDEGWGVTVMLGLPGGLSMMLYEPRHATAISDRPRAKAKKAKAADRPTARKPVRHQKAAPKRVATTRPSARSRARRRRS